MKQDGCLTTIIYFFILLFIVSAFIYLSLIVFILILISLVIYAFYLFIKNRINFSKSKIIKKDNKYIFQNKYIKITYIINVKNKNLNQLAIYYLKFENTNDNDINNIDLKNFEYDIFKNDNLISNLAKCSKKIFVSAKKSYKEKYDREYNYESLNPFFIENKIYDDFEYSISEENVSITSKTLNCTICLIDPYEITVQFIYDNGLVYEKRFKNKSITQKIIKTDSKDLPRILKNIILLINRKYRRH